MYEELLESMLGGLVPEAILGLIVGAIMFVLVLLLLYYVYSSLAVMYTARRLKVPNPELAWIPLVGKPLVMSKAAQMEWWPVLLIVGTFIPFINWLASLALTVFVYIWWWKITERRKMPGWIVLLTLVPVLGWIWGAVLWGILAWGKD